MSGFWTEQRVRDLRRLTREDGLSASAIAAELGCTRNAVIGKVARMGIGLPGAGTRGPARPRAKAAVHVRPAPRQPTAADRIFEKAAIRRANAPRPAAGRKPDRASDPMVGPPEPQAATTAEGEAEITAPALPPVPFSQASAAGTCLFFAGDPFGPSGMDMPVCGAPRARGRYCAFHARAAVDPEAAARLRSRGRAAA